ncbi:MAG: hypothetical protein JO141_08640 [Bradyrhizobium sp.]|nr:hypothetical protein [Bradyrhizobium sp.]
MMPPKKMPLSLHEIVALLPRDFRGDTVHPSARTDARPAVHVPRLQRIPGRLFAFGVRPEHIHTMAA